MLRSHFSAEKKNTLLLVGLYLGCGLLVIAFVNLYPLYDHLVRTYGLHLVSYAPFLPPAVLLPGFAAFFAVRSLPVKWPWLLPGLVLLAFALFIPDPEIAVKRIHVSEYLCLSFVARYAMSLRLSGKPLLLFATLFTAVLGIHDELLQGIHPSRTYGLRDMLVNAVAAIGGGFIWHGLSFFTARKTAPDSTGSSGKQGKAVHFLYLGWLVIAVLALIVPLMAYRHMSPPLWPCLPLAAAAVFWVCLPRRDDSAIRHGLLALSAASFLLLLYPVAINRWQLAFF